MQKATENISTEVFLPKLYLPKFLGFNIVDFLLFC